MATVGALGLAFGTAGLITILETTFSAYRHLVEEPASFGKDMAGLYSMFLYEYFRFEVWGAEIVGMLREQNRVRSPNSPNSQEGHGQVSAAVDPTNNKFQHPLLNAVSQVQGVLAEIDELVLKYKVKEAKVRSEIQTTSVTTGVVVVPRLGEGSGDAEVAGSILRSRAFEKQLMKINSRWRKFMFGVQAWSSADKTIFRKLIDSMQYWNNCILEIGSRSHHGAIDLAASSKLLDGIVDREQLDDVAKVSSGVSMYAEMSRRASMKKQYNYPDDSNPQKSARISLTGFVLSAWKKNLQHVQLPQKDAARVLARYVARDLVDASASIETQPLVIEWRYYLRLKNLDEKTALESQAGRLAALLESPDKPQQLCTPGCLGFVDDCEKKRLGFLYRLPSWADPFKSPTTLHHYLQGQVAGTPLPTLSERRSLAHKLAVSLMEFMNAGWFHKNLNSRNILFFARSGVASQSPKWDFSSPWVTGFDFARPNQKDEHSFEVDSGENDIYRHPDLRQNIENIEEHGRIPYRRQFDVYSLGLVLLEIGLWTPLSNICNQKDTPTKATARFKAACNLNVPHQMGTSYNELVLRCLDGDHRFHDEEEDQEDGEDRGEGSSSVAVSPRKGTDVSLVAFYWKVIRVLEQCDCRE
ncbi:hypothetical protein K440DRAFT_620878 [Wilcoxina mikolae CBS 423.85]|nr:hypothetical protein K440DRAFT_620878 [Wilcoxina mikolae CBS 423.85]